MKTSFELAQIFTDGMVIQREYKVPIWGTGIDGEKIKIEFCGQVLQTEVVNGKWKLLLSPIPAGGPYDMTIEDDISKLILKDILVGEVWVAGGQSNMAFSLEGSLNGKEEILQSNYPFIRYFEVPRIAYESNNVEELSIPKWKICNPENSGAFSAVAYHFAKNIFREIDIPIGIIGCNWGGTTATCWINQDKLCSDEELKVFIDEYEIYNKISDEEYDIQCDEYNSLLTAYRSKIEEFKTMNPNATKKVIDENVGLYPWPPPRGKKSFLRPGGLYHTMVKKIIPYGIRGVIWYQGESDRLNKPRLYKKLFNKLILNWREIWNNDELPFLFVQLPYFEDSITEVNATAIIREAQLCIMKEDKNTAMAIITDCGEKDNIHPINKKPVGERLALLARAEIYGQNIQCNGPIYSYMETYKDRIILHFEHAEKGLLTQGERLKGFKLCGEDKKFIKARAEIQDNTVVVYTDSIKNPIEVRYGWENYSEVNLYNVEGLPASPFRTDNFI
jgi:sialate O-acetylesterase